MKKILDQIDIERNENEYNRTLIYERAKVLKETAESFKFDINSSNSLRLVDTTDRILKYGNYMNKLINNQNLNKKVKKAKPIGYLQNNLVHLQIKGKSQLIKEIEETQNVENKFLDFEALHRNEETYETE